LIPACLKSRLGMDAETTKALAAFGFLTVLESPEHGVFGGYLVLSPHGRPLEFRCSTPVVASRAQEILYGPTLRPYLFADVVGQSLVAGAELPVEVILTDQRDMLPLALIRPEEVLLVEQAVEDSQPSLLEAFVTINGCRVIAAPTSTIDAQRIARLLQPMAAHVILIEPFERIRAALLEAQASAQDASEFGDDRAAA
jgi:hypothetical protein